MTTMFMVWLVCGVYSSAMLMFMVWWDRRQHDVNADRVTLWNAMVAAFCAWCPIINMFVTLGMTVWFCVEVAPRIVLFEGQQ